MTWAILGNVSRGFMRSIKFEFKLWIVAVKYLFYTHSTLEDFPNHWIKICLGLIDSEERPHLSNLPQTILLRLIGRCFGE